MLTIYYNDNSTQVLRNFHESILTMEKFKRLTLLREIANDIAKGAKHTIKWEDLN